MIKLKDNSTKEIDTALYQLEQSIKKAKNSSSDTDASALIEKEASEREAADSTLQKNISTEASEREAADSVLSSSIAFKQDKLTAESPVTLSNSTIGLTTVPISKGGTGATTAKAAEYNVLNGMTEDDSDPEDTSMYAGVYLTPSTTQGKLYKRSALHLWNYIKSKISSVLGLTASSYGGTASKANTATGLSYTGESSYNVSAEQLSSSFNNSEASWASYIICNHGNGTTYYHQMLRLSFFEDKIQLQRREGGTLKGWKTIAILSNANTWSAKQTFSSGIVIPTSQPSTLANGDIWIV